MPVQRLWWKIWSFMLRVLIQKWRSVPSRRINFFCPSGSLPPPIRSLLPHLLLRLAATPPKRSRIFTHLNQWSPLAPRHKSDWLQKGHLHQCLFGTGRRELTGMYFGLQRRKLLGSIKTATWKGVWRILVLRNTCRILPPGKWKQGQWVLLNQAQLLCNLSETFHLLWRNRCRLGMWATRCQVPVLDRHLPLLIRELEIPSTLVLDPRQPMRFLAVKELEWTEAQTMLQTLLQLGSGF
jgi:hypothetical protein